MAVLQYLSSISGSGGGLSRRFDRSRATPRTSSMSGIGSSLQPASFQASAKNPVYSSQADATIALRQMGGLSGAFASGFSAPIATGQHKLASTNTDGLTVSQRTERLNANRKAAQSDFQSTWSSSGVRRGTNSRMKDEEDGNDY